MPGVVRKPVDSHSGFMQAHLGLVLHVQVGDGSCYGEFSNPSNQASSTWWIAKDGTIEQYVDSDLAAWTEAAGNFTWDSVETEGVPGEALTPAQVQSLARIFAWGSQQYGWPLVTSDAVDARGLGWHGMGGLPWGGHFGCPGDLRKAQRPPALFLASLILQPNPTPPPQEADVPVSAAITFKPNQRDVFQVANGFLLHKFMQPIDRWGTEVLAGPLPGGVAFKDPLTFPDQEPQVSVNPNGSCEVIVEDANKRVWFFQQTQAATTWGVNLLP